MATITVEIEQGEVMSLTITCDAMWVEPDPEPDERDEEGRKFSVSGL